MKIMFSLLTVFDGFKCEKGVSTLFDTVISKTGFWQSKTQASNTVNIMHINKGLVSREHINKGFVSWVHINKGFVSRVHINKGLVSRVYIRKGVVSTHQQRDN